MLSCRVVVRLLITLPRTYISALSIASLGRPAYLSNEESSELLPTLPLITCLTIMEFVIRTILSVLFLTLLFLYPATGQTPSQFVPDVNTVALWHYNELSGSLVRDSSFNYLHGTATGTTIVTGRFGNARNFNGTSDYVYVPNSSRFNVDQNQSFTIDVWFKTTQTNTGEFVRRGLAPLPGFALRILEGRVQGVIGNREDGHPPDTLLRITSAQSYNDGNWHLASLERDRARRKLSLYVDGIEAATPMGDNFPYALSSDRPLTMGAWENFVVPAFFRGTLDEVRISNIARHAPPIVSDTVALWHYDETSGNNVFDSSPYRNDGTAYATTIVPGRIGNARSFSGSFSYVYVPYPGTISMNFASNQSFTVQAWFKTTQPDTGEIIRRGLAPVPGFALRILDGHVQGVIGNREFSLPPDTLLRITSTQANFNDGQWHVATLVRDRQPAKLFLYVDGRQVASPLNDNFPYAISNDRPLTMGAWENFVRPTFYRGLIDEVSIFKGARHPINIGVPNIEVSPNQISFGNVLVGSNATRLIEISNLSFFDTLRVTSIVSNNPVFVSSPSSLSVPPGTSRIIQATYTPTAARVDTGALSINSNDPNKPTVRVRLNGQGFTPSPAPLIASITDIPEDQGKQVRVIWYRSIYDGIVDSLRITQYSVWRRVGQNNSLWDFVASIPAVRFQQYAYVAPTLFDSTRSAGIRWSVFRVSAHTANGAQVFFSAADSGYSVDNMPPAAPTNLIASLVGSHVNLGWDAPPDPDIEMFAVYRSTIPNFLPSSENQIGTTNTTGFIDQSIGGSPAYYYCVAAFDTAGNRGAFSNQVRVLVTGVGGGNNLPTDFALYQNYPNPFNPSSIISYDVPSNSYVTIKVYDMLGKVVATIVDQPRSAGHYEVHWSAQNLASGVYVYRMQAGSYVNVKKMILMR